MEESRLERARKNGAALSVSAADKNLKERLGVFTNGGADIVVEASGSSPGVELARSLLRRKPQCLPREGKLAFVIHLRALKFSTPDLDLRVVEKDLQFSIAPEP